MTLEAVGDLATVAALLILVYVQDKPAINRWATVRFLRGHYEIHPDDLVPIEPSRSLNWSRRLGRVRRSTMFRFAQTCMTREQRISRYDLIWRLHEARKQPNRMLMISDFSPLVITAVTLSRSRQENRDNRRRRRIHKGLLGDGGCGTHFGKRRHDHNFDGGGGIKGGWFCPSSDSCRERPTGKHYCGMCQSEERASSIPGEHQEVEKHSPDMDGEKHPLPGGTKRST